MKVKPPANWTPGHNRRSGNMFLREYTAGLEADVDSLVGDPDRPVPLRKSRGTVNGVRNHPIYSVGNNTPTGEPRQTHDNVLTEEQREEIRVLLRKGHSINKTARILGHTVPTVHYWAKKMRAAGEQIANFAPPHAANQAVRDYHARERIELGNAGFERLREILPNIKTARSMQHWAIAFGILTDKRRLEDGDATSITQHLDRDTAKSLLMTKITEIAARQEATQLIQEASDATRLALGPGQMKTAYKHVDTRTLIDEDESTIIEGESRVVDTHQEASPTPGGSKHNGNVKPSIK